MKLVREVKPIKAPTVVSKIIDVPIMALSLVAVGVFAVIIYFSAETVIGLVQYSTDWKSKIFFFGVLAAIIWGCMGFAQGFINVFGKTYRHFFTKGETREVKE